MKGLLVKDFCLAAKHCRLQLVICLVFPLLGSFSGDALFLQIYPFMLCSMIPVSLMAYDEHDHWDSYSFCLPCSRAQIVTGKYLMGAMASGAALLLAGLVNGTMFLVRDTGWDLPGLLVLQLAAGLLPGAFCLPFIFKLGSEKGRMAYFITIGAFCGLTVGLGNAAAGLPAMAFGPGVLLLMAALSLAAYGISWLISVKIYEKREV